MAKIWVFVGDGSRGRIFRTNRAAPLEEVEDRLNPAARISGRDLASDRPGATSDRSGYALHGVGGDKDPRAEEMRRFAREIAERLRAAHREGDFERLFLVAPAAFLGELRQCLAPAVRESVVGEMAKDLSRLNPAEIRAHLPELI